MSRAAEIFEDDRGQLSSGRVYAAYCVVAALGCWVAGAWMPQQAAHAQAGMNAFLAAAFGFYTGGKVTERFGKQAPPAPPAMPGDGGGS